MAKKQSRRSISVRGVTYWRLREFCAKRNVTMSDHVERLISVDFARCIARGEDVPPEPPGTKPPPTKKPAPRPLPSVHDPRTLDGIARGALQRATVGGVPVGTTVARGEAIVTVTETSSALDKPKRPLRAVAQVVKPVPLPRPVVPGRALPAPMGMSPATPAGVGRPKPTPVDRVKPPSPPRRTDSKADAALQRAPRDAGTRML